MPKNPRWKWLGLLALVLGALLALRNRLEALVYPGLALKGGTHMVIELEVEYLAPKISLNDAISQTIEIIRNRVEQFGVVEPLIVRQGARRIVVQLPGVTDSVRAKELVGEGAFLYFRMVNETEKGRAALKKILESGSPFIGAAVSTTAARLVPEGMVLVAGKDGTAYLLNDAIPLTGDQLETAKVRTGGKYRQPVVGFKFKPEFTATFSNLTASNIGKRMAIVLNNTVYSAPVIKGRISDGSGFIEGQFSADDARMLAIFLRSGHLPAPVKVIEERVVGPTVGSSAPPTK